MDVLIAAVHGVLVMAVVLAVGLPLLWAVNKLLGYYLDCMERWNELT